MDFGIMYANTGHGSTPDGAVALVQAAEAGGFAAAWTVEHVVVPSGYESPYPYDPSGKMAGGAEDFDLPDPLVWLAYVAARTERIKLGTGVLVLPQRNPVVTAKAVATIDHLSGGRMVLGVGAGWLREEFDALGVPFDDRGARFDEYIDALRALWTDDKASYDGKYVSFTDCICRPRPVNGAIPIVIGGHTKRAATRAGTRGDAFFPASASTDDIAQLTPVMHAAALAAGRDAASIAIYSGGGSAPGDAMYRRIEQLIKLGVSHTIVPAFPPDKLAGIGEDLVSRFGD